MMRASFRDYINILRKNNELLEIAKPVDLRNVAALVSQSEKALLFKNVAGYAMPVVSPLEHRSAPTTPKSLRRLRFVLRSAVRKARWPSG